MQVSVQPGEGLERRMRIDLPTEQVMDEMNKRLRELAREARVPGFRPGKVPVSVVRQRYGERVCREIVADLARSTFPEAVESENLHPISVPTFESDIDLGAKRFGYTVTFDVMPSVELASLEGRVVKRPECELNEADVDAMIERLRQQHRTWHPVEREAQTGDRLVVDLDGESEGEALEGGKGERVPIELGSGRMLKELEDGLLGVRADEERTLELTFPEDYRVERLAGRQVRFQVKVHEVAESRIPELDEEFVKSLGIADGDLERFRVDVRANMERELRQRLAVRTRERVMTVLLEANPIELPRSLVEKEVAAIAQRVQLHPQMLVGLAAIQERIEAVANRRIALGLLVGEIVRLESLSADPEQVRAEVMLQASTYEEPQSVVDYFYADPSRLEAIENVVLEQQVVDYLLSQMRVEVERLSFEELTQPSDLEGLVDEESSV